MILFQEDEVHHGNQQKEELEWSQERKVISKYLLWMVKWKYIALVMRNVCVVVHSNKTFNKKSCFHLVNTIITILLYTVH